MAALLLIAAALVWLHRCGASVCLLHRLTGLPCLTCGSTRAFAALAAGDPAAALRLQPLAVLGGAFAGAAFAAYSVNLICLRRVARVRLERREALLLCFLVIVLVALNWLYLVRCGV